MEEILVDNIQKIQLYDEEKNNDMELNMVLKLEFLEFFDLSLDDEVI